ncbi:MAG TPA: hypothetical protein VGB83_06420 [Actinomycetota bacterium]
MAAVLAGALVASGTPAQATHWAKVASGTITVGVGNSVTKIVAEQNNCSPQAGGASVDGVDSKVLAVPAAWRGRDAKVVMSQGFASLYEQGCSNRDTESFSKEGDQWLAHFSFANSHRTLILSPSFTAGADVAWELWVRHPG